MLTFHIVNSEDNIVVDQWFETYLTDFIPIIKFL